MNKKVFDNWNDFYVIRNTVGVDSVTFFNRETLEFETYEEGEIEESKKLLRIPYDCELYNENKVLGEYIAINKIDIPSESDSTRCYLRETGQIYNFHEYRDVVFVKKLNEWFKENQIEVEFRMELETQEETGCVDETQEETGCVDETQEETGCVDETQEETGCVDETQEGMSCVEDCFNLNEN